VTESHRFAKAGAFTVTLTVTDSAGKTGANSKQITVGAVSNAPNAQFTVSPGQVQAGRLAFFDATVSTAIAGRTIVKYEWNFGDNVIVEGARIEHVFNPAGTYTVTLTVTDSGGGVDTETKTVSVIP
jgi:PKD repeat protein